MAKRNFKLRIFLKVVVIAICLTSVTKVVAQSNVQFPSPQNFQVYLTYIEWGDWGFCAGEPVYGPYHCTSTQWDEPNLAGIESQLVGYRIYNYPSMIELEEIPFDEGQIIEQTVETGLTTGGGYQGYIWVTAVYSEPDGESEPSNVVFCRLPLGINKNEIKSHSIFFNNQMKTVEIIGGENVVSINIFGIEGRLIAASESNKIDVKHLTKGVYIIKVTTKTGKIISEKLIIE